MSNWKELGEVPDSEDEDGFESQELPSLPAVIPTPTDKIDTEENDDRDEAVTNHDESKEQNNDIWDVPDSSQELLQLAPPTKTSTQKDEAINKPLEPRIPIADVWNIPSSSPLSSLGSDDELLGADYPHPQPPTITAEDRPLDQSEQDDEVTGEISNTYLERSSPPPEVEGTRGVAQPVPSPVHQNSDSVPLQSQDLSMDEHQAAQQTAIRYERSFRPRKPIQERPYAIEMSNYSNVLRKHGVRPLRLALEGEKRRRQQAEQDASQDKDFEDDSQGSHLPDISDESQLKGLEEFLDGLETLDVPSPSPPKTSPRISRAGPSSQASSAGDTENTSIADDDLPALKDLLRRPPTTVSKQATKRKSSPSRSSARKRKRYDVVDSDPLEPASAFRLGPGTTDSPAAQRSSRRTEDILLPTAEGSDPELLHPPVTTGSARPFVRPTQRAPQISTDDSEDELAGPTTMLQPNVQGSTTQSDSDSGSESGSEIVNTVGRRIRGVLPASWLRLDQQSGHKKPSKDTQKKPVAFSPEREIRRGVAQRRIATPSASTTLEMFFEESDDDVDPVPTLASRQKTTDETFSNQTRLLIQDEPPIFVPADHFDDEGSAIEDNAIDYMAVSRKRQLNLSESFNGTAKRHRSSSFQRKSSAAKRPHQPRITSMLSGSRHASVPALESVKKKHRQSAVKRSGKKRSSKNVLKPFSPPRLGILDVVEPDAPRFLKIAARSATRRQDMGRSSPSRKFIKLATRDDHVDAVSILSNWRSGSIPQRPSVTTARKAKTSKPKPRGSGQPLGITSGNGSPISGRTLMQHGVSRRLVKQVSQAGSVRYQTDSNTAEPQATSRRLTTPARTASGLARPAQLETDDRDGITRFSFNAKKKRLDHLYRKQRGDLSASSIMTFDNAPDTFYPASPPAEENPVPIRVVEEPVRTLNKSRFRKKTKPQRIDLEAPQFSRANDPIPMATVATEPLQSGEACEKKMQGLGPYGTQYTHHFETFPLNSHVYFHDSTLIGSGFVEKARSAVTCQHLLEPRPRMSFNFGEQVLRWGPWDAQVSSELGVLLDSIADQVDPKSLHGELPDTKFITSAAGFIMKFMLDSLSFADHTQIKIFVCRALEVLQGFNSRVSALLRQQDDTTQPHFSLIASAYDYLLLATLFVLKLCQGEASLMNEQFQMEDLLKGLSVTAITALTMVGMDQITETYNDLKDPRTRERGLRNNVPVIHSWVINMKVLEHAHILRASFWDILYMVMATPEALMSLDANVHEGLWRNTFTLLPLIEFNDQGIVIAGSRHDAVVDGWTLPQKLLKNVFQVYQDNSRQSPSFNSYCRALVGRCHYLVQQWGWRKCVPVIGVIFDFFGSQNLAHFRNEEVYASPKFLDELASHPSLSVDEADKCFHIFLKLVALSIKKLSDIGSLKDIRNLIARTMPNHNRQLLKEQIIQERDLAALRNHHDLLCTLFWASPVELRPSAHLIERLVAPASSHKEACLINLRAWSQLARFVVSSGEATTSFKPFGQWRNNFFQSMLHQFDSVQSDMQQQVLAMSKDGSNTVDQGLVDAMVAMNKRAVMDVLYMSVTTSLDVMKHAPNLEAATFALSTQQMQQVFHRFGACPPGFDWCILRSALGTLDVFLSRIDDFKEDEESQQSESQILESAQADDAILVVDHDLSRVYFSMARCILSSHGEQGDPSTVAEVSQCTEQVIILTARLAIRFINGGLLRLADMFKNGKYSLFEDIPAKLSLDQRRHLTLFMTTLLRHGFDDFDEAEFPLSEVWALSIVKPRPYLSYENQFAEQLWKQKKDFVPEAVLGLSINPDYNSNRDLFEFTISWMRKSLRDAGPALKKVIMAEHSRTLKLVMEQIQRDLHTMCSDVSEHPSYVAFVRNIIALIRAHGSEICKIDAYFYQITKEYSPSVQDPQLQVAGMMSYGLRLTEGDNKAVHEVFYFLCNNFKLSLKENKLRDAVLLLHKGMENRGILSFILGKMLPAIVRATGAENYAFAMIEVYAEALRNFMVRDVIPREWTEEDVPSLLALFRAIVDFLKQLSQTDGSFHAQQVHSITQVLYLSNILWPSLRGLSLSKMSHESWSDVAQALKAMRTGLVRAEAHVADMIEMEDYSLAAEMLLSGFRSQGPTPHPTGRDMKTFTDNIINDIRRLWVTSGPSITIQAPGRGLTQTQSGQGTPAPVWEPESLVSDLYNELRVWNQWWIEVFGKEPRITTTPIPVLF
ncbi:hypothetical protein LB507_006995 [Fusarium sp. FIESC RH6]|nr:hypothetical protein LB507_006995 [Fusarium sp. FIESC RH6]